MGSPASTPSRRRTGTVIATAVAVALVVAGVAAATLTGGAEPTEPASGPVGTVATDPLLDLDGATVTEDAARAFCLPGDFTGDPASVDVLYAVQQRSQQGEEPVVLLRRPDGELRLCDAAGPDAPAQAPVPAATTSDPVAFLTNGRMAWDCSGRTIDGYTATAWLAVAPTVDRVQQRYWVDGVARPWFSARARDGYVHLQTWLAGPFADGTALAVQHRVLDADGAAVAQSALPTRRVALSGCHGGDAEIG